jgi:nicotinate-nucleotide adenylyltransferase
VLGGTFDPPHLGHLLLAHEAWWQLGLDEVRLVPGRQPPHKPAPRLDGERRAALVAAAVADHPALSLSRSELDRPGPSYTADTLEQMAAAEPAAERWFILGGDQLMGFSTWHRPERILELARLAITVRHPADRERLEAHAARVAPGRVDWIHMPEIGVSSSLVRARIAAGEPVRYLVPSAVEAMLRGEPPAGGG